MSVLIMSRPIVNAGDFLFSEKSLEAFERITPDKDIVRGHISDEYDLDYLNQFESIVVAGGPLYDNAFLNKKSFPMLNLLDDIVPPIYFLAAGWYGRDNLLKSIYSYRFDDEVAELLRTIEAKGGAFSCRDYYTTSVLKNNGLRDVSMVGCSAWYDFDRLEVSEPCYNGKINKIIISDQGITKDSCTWEWKFKSLKALVEAVRFLFPDSVVSFTFNGGIKTKYSAEYNTRVAEYLEKNGIKYYDISGSSEGFKLCEEADLHVGFRVHSHIYCMSKRIPSVLISEDARGSGCNQAMGLRDITDYSAENGCLSENKYLKRQIEDYLEDLMKTEFRLLCGSYSKMNVVFEDSFRPFIKRCCKEL